MKNLPTTAFLFLSFCTFRATVGIFIQHNETKCFGGIRNASRFLVYSDGSKHAVGVPYLRGGSAQIIGEIANILISEQMGYESYLFDPDTIFAASMINYVAGCFDPNDLVCAPENRDVDNPRVHFSLETWFNGQIRAEQTLPLNIRPTLISEIDYNVIDTFFLLPATFEKAKALSPPVWLNSFEFYNAETYKPHLVSLGQ